MPPGRPYVTAFTTCDCVGASESRFGPAVPVEPAAFIVWQLAQVGLDVAVKTVRPEAGLPTSVSVAGGAAPPPPVEAEPPPPVEGLVPTAASAADSESPTPIRPFIPAAAWPGTVHRYSYLPPLSTILSVCD